MKLSLNLTLEREIAGGELERPGARTSFLKDGLSSSTGIAHPSLSHTSCLPIESLAGAKAPSGRLRACGQWVFRYGKMVFLATPCPPPNLETSLPVGYASPPFYGQRNPTG